MSPPESSRRVANPSVVDAPVESMRPLFPTPRILSIQAFDAETLLYSARQQAAEIIDEALREHDAMRSKAAQALIEARMRGRQEGIAEIEGLLELTRRGLSEYEMCLGQKLAQTAIDLAAAVVDLELRTSAEAVVKMARAALARARLYGRVTLVMHPDQYGLAGSRFDELAGNADERSPLTIRQDETVQAGCLRIETDMGQFDVNPFERLPSADAIPLPRSETRQPNR